MKRAKKFWVYDLETLSSLFIAVFYDLDSDEQRVFYIYDDHDDFDQLIDFLKESIACKDWHLGFNNLAFDSQIIQYILSNQYLFNSTNAAGRIKLIYDYAQKTIAKSDTGEYLDYPEFKLRIPQIDIYKLNHWESQPKRSSLKFIQYSMDWYNVEEMPHPHDQPVTDENTMNMVLEYCHNDVASTKAIFKLKNGKGEEVMISQINLRAELSRTYDLRLHSASEPKISRDIFLWFLSKKLGIDKYELKSRRTFRENVVVKDILLPYIDLSIPEFRTVHSWFKNLVIDTRILENEKKIKGPSYTMHYKGAKTVFALGGIHGCTKPGMYVAGNGKKILSVDVNMLRLNSLNCLES